MEWNIQNIGVLVAITSGVIGIILLVRKGIYYVENREFIVSLDVFNKSSNILNVDNKACLDKIINGMVPQMLTGMPECAKRRLVLELFKQGASHLLIRKLKNKRTNLCENNRVVSATVSSKTKRMAMRVLSLPFFGFMFYFCYQILMYKFIAGVPDFINLASLALFELLAIFLWNYYPGDKYLNKINMELSNFVIEKPINQ